ncbi:MAG: amidohydrolase [Bacillota bacterium]
MEARASIALQYIDDRQDVIVDVSDRIWAYAELGLHEHDSAEYMAQALRREGFEVQTDVAEMPTALVARWGSGCPVIGFLGEYDALPGVSQKAVPSREELVAGGPGHACGHNLLGAGAFGAVIGLKRQLEVEGLPGTVMFFGCPAEEAFSGKAFMARDGFFAECDACLTWHPGVLNVVRTGSSLAIDSMSVTFHGLSAHAAGDPYNGRSALDAVQLMNMGVEFLREHVQPSARIHYVVTGGGEQPNVVPAEAEVWYYVRAPERAQVDELYERVMKCADGAAQMTDTTYTVEFLESIWDILNNRCLENLLSECMDRVDPPRFGPEEKRFAEEISQSFAPGQRRDFFARTGLDADEFEGCVLNESVIAMDRVKQEAQGSTDVADVSRCCPTAQFSTACSAFGTPGHSWQLAAQAGMGIGHSGMLTAARILAEAGFELLTNPEILAWAAEEFREKTGGQPYRSSMPADAKPAFHQLAGQCKYCSSAQ